MIEHTHAKKLVRALEHELPLIVKLFIINVTMHIPQNRVSDTKYHKQSIVGRNLVVYIIWFCAPTSETLPKPNTVFMGKFMGGRPQRPSPKLVARHY